ncbi:MAG TPA: YfiR family protein [Rhizobacter sp.]
MRRTPWLARWPRRWALAMPLLACAPAQAVEAPELKVAIVYNILQFVEWPADADSPRLTLCVDAAGMLASYFKPLAGRPVQKRQLDVADMGEGFDNWKQCHAVFVDASSRRSAGLAARVPNALPVLVLGDDAEGRGLMVHLVESAGRVGFNVDLGAARRARLQISSRLLRLAKKVAE